MSGIFEELDTELTEEAGEPVMLQYFDYSDSGGPEGDHWTRVASEAERISEVGFDGIWVQCPAEPNTEVSNGYNPKNLLNWDSDLGTEQEFDEMKSELDRNDVEIYIDGVLNHAGTQHPDQADYQLEREHFHPPDASGRTKMQLHDLWSLDHSNPEVVEYLNDFVNLAEEKDVDGYRWDAAKHIPEWFFEHHVDEWISEDSFTVGEAFDNDMDLLNNYIETGMKMFDFPLYFRMEEGFRPNGDIRKVSAAADSGNCDEQSILAQNPGKSTTFVENHDTGPPEHEKLAYAFMLTAPGHATVYSNHAEDHEGVDFDAGWLRDLIDIKKNLASGEMDFHGTENPWDVMVYSRDNYIVGINKSDEDYVSDIDENLVDLTNGNGVIDRNEGFVIPEKDYIVCMPAET